MCAVDIAGRSPELRERKLPAPRSSGSGRNADLLAIAPGECNGTVPMRSALRVASGKADGNGIPAGCSLHVMDNWDRA